MAGKFFPVDPKGTYLRTNNDSGAHRATEISLVGLRVKPGHWVGLQASGTWDYGNGVFDQRNLIGCFARSSGGAPVMPRIGQILDVKTLPTYDGNIATDIPQDFFIPGDRKVILLVPDGAKFLKLSTPDTYFGDNKGNSLGVIFSLPNAVRPGLSSLTDDHSTDRVISTESCFGELSDSDELELRRTLAAVISLRDPPVATTMQGHPFAGPNDPTTWPQARGWYKNGPSFSPASSDYNPSGSGTRKHFGIDIFVPKGTRLAAAVGPADLIFVSGVAGYGNIAILRFIFRKKIYSVIYAHLDGFVGGTRVVKAGDEIAISGCSGNAAAENCGTELSTGGFSDHVHIGAYEGRVISDANGVTTNPAALLKWTVKNHSDL